MFLDVLVRSVLFPKLLDELLESKIPAIALSESVGLAVSIVFVFSVVSVIASFINTIRGVEFRSIARR